MLAALKAVDRVEIFDTDQELIDYIKNFEPDVMVKGSDYRGAKILGEQYCKEIRFYERLEKYSTTNTIKDIINRG
jgi:bifunctional ADP-heptose synthase (sugar kinase/adenylyltransferase)